MAVLVHIAWGLESNTISTATADRVPAAIALVGVQVPDHRVGRVAEDAAKAFSSAYFPPSVVGSVEGSAKVGLLE
jgi:hypothetical protein